MYLVSSQQPRVMSPRDYGTGVGMDQIPSASARRNKVAFILGAIAALTFAACSAFYSTSTSELLDGAPPQLWFQNFNKMLSHQNPIRSNSRVRTNKLHFESPYVDGFTGTRLDEAQIRKSSKKSNQVSSFLNGGGEKLHKVGIPVDSWPWDSQHKHSSFAAKAGGDTLLRDIDNAFDDTPHPNPLLTPAQRQALLRKYAAATTINTGTTTTTKPAKQAPPATIMAAKETPVEEEHAALGDTAEQEAAAAAAEDQQEVADDQAEARADAAAAAADRQPAKRAVVEGRVALGAEEVAASATAARGFARLSNSLGVDADRVRQLGGAGAGADAEELTAQELQAAAYSSDKWATVAAAAGPGGQPARDWGRRAAERLRADASDMAAVADRDVHRGRFAAAAAAAAAETRGGSLDGAERWWEQGLAREMRRDAAVAADLAQKLAAAAAGDAAAAAEPRAQALLPDEIRVTPPPMARREDPPAFADAADAPTEARAAAAGWAGSVPAEAAAFYPGGGEY